MLCLSESRLVLSGKTLGQGWFLVLQHCCSPLRLSSHETLKEGQRCAMNTVPFRSIPLLLCCVYILLLLAFHLLLALGLDEFAYCGCLPLKVPCIILSIFGASSSHYLVINLDTF